MTKAKKSKKCSRQKGLMYGYWLIQLGTRVISTVSLVAIAFGLGSVQKEVTVFNDCVEEVRTSRSSISGAVHFCNGGK